MLKSAELSYARMPCLAMLSHKAKALLVYIEVARLVLEDGTIFRGTSLGADVLAFGEIVFNTGMSGYQEVITDPSYAGQIITFTYPEIGNYGCNAEDIESAVYWGAYDYQPPRTAKASFARAIVIKNYSPVYSNYRAQESLEEFLRRESIAAIQQIDTRALTRHIRDQGAMRAVVAPDIFDDISDSELLERVRGSQSMTGLDLVSTVTCSRSYIAQRTDTLYDRRCYPEPRYHVVAMDFGIKQNILNCLIKQACRVEVVPAHTSAADILKLNPDAIFLSNGPGDPEAVTYAIETVRELVSSFDRPIFGICLGHQILALAASASSYKLKFGHRGANQPIRNLRTGQIEIASHNHGFAISAEDLPEELEISHININDNTVAGLRYRHKPIFSVQYHPEASPGPHDSHYLFADFLSLMQSKVLQKGPAARLYFSDFI